MDLGLHCGGLGGWIFGFLQSDRWKSTPSRPSAIVGSGPNSSARGDLMGITN